jgi:hypothetical protein
MLFQASPGCQIPGAADNRNGSTGFGKCTPDFALRRSCNSRTSGEITRKDYGLSGSSRRDDPDVVWPVSQGVCSLCSHSRNGWGNNHNSPNGRTAEASIHNAAHQDKRELNPPPETYRASSL